MIKTLLLTATLLLGSCASVAINYDDLMSATSRALNVDKGHLIISNRSDSGVTTHYTAKLADGRVYQCYMTGTLSYVGPASSSAICSEPGNAIEGSQSNPLLRAYEQQK